MKPRPTSRPPKSPTASQSVLPTTATTTTRSPRSPSSPAKAKSLTLRRLRALYSELQARDSNSKYPWRVLILVFLAFVLVSIVQFLVSSVWSVLPLANVNIPTYSIYQRYDEVFYNGSDFAYIPTAKIFMTTTAKAGSTSIWTWLYPGLTGQPNFNACNQTYIQDFHAPCWQGTVVHPRSMTNEDRWKMLNSPEVLRVAVTRNPFERILSAWKSKAACESDDFGTDVRDRDIIVPKMLRQAQMRKGASCLSINSFAEVLDTLRRMSEQGAFKMSRLNKHFRPQECHFDLINYDIIMDVRMLDNMTALQPIVDRMPFPDLLTEPPARLHTSRPTYQTLSEPTASLLYKFALLTEPLPREMRLP